MTALKDISLDDDLAPATHAHDYAPTAHGHAENAPAVHGHTGYAADPHTHAYEAGGAVALHEGATNPHPTYSHAHPYATTGHTHSYEAAGAVAAHAAATDPHGIYATDGDLATHAGNAAAHGSFAALMHTHVTYQPVAEKGLPNGYAGLDATGKVPAAQLPAAAPATIYGVQVVLHPPYLAASAAATNLAANAFLAVGDPNYRQMVDLRGMAKVRLMARIGGSLVAATKLRVRFHLAADPAIATGDANWQVLADSAGSHTLNVIFYSAEIAVPAAAQANNVLLQAGLFSGDGVADPTITACLLNVYP